MLFLARPGGKPPGFLFIWVVKRFQKPDFKQNAGKFLFLFNLLVQLCKK